MRILALVEDSNANAGGADSIWVGMNLQLTEFSHQLDTAGRIERQKKCMESLPPVGFRCLNEAFFVMHAVPGTGFPSLVREEDVPFPRCRQMMYQPFQVPIEGVQSPGGIDLRKDSEGVAQTSDGNPQIVDRLGGPVCDSCMCVADDLAGQPGNQVAGRNAGTGLGGGAIDMVTRIRACRSQGRSIRGAENKSVVLSRTEL